MSVIEELVTAFYAERARTLREPIGVVMTHGMRGMLMAEQRMHEPVGDPDPGYRPGDRVMGVPLHCPDGPQDAEWFTVVSRRSFDE